MSCRFSIPAQDFSWESSPRTYQAHLISGYSSDELFLRVKSPAQILEDLEALCRHWPRFATFDVEYNSLRKHIAETLRFGAEQLGDGFFDPSDVVRKMGQEAFFMKDGQDFDHMTPEAAQVLSARYKQMLRSLRTRTA